MSGLLRDAIGGPRQVHGASSPEEYLAMAREFRARHGVDETLQDWSGPPPVAFVSGSRWVIACLVCENGPSASREWGMAVCFECGTIFTPVFPPEAEAIEAVLLARPVIGVRNYLPTETVTSLVTENLMHGIRPARPVRTVTDGLD